MRSEHHNQIDLERSAGMTRRTAIFVAVLVGLSYGLEAIPIAGIAGDQQSAGRDTGSAKRWRCNGEVVTVQGSTGH